MLLLSFPLQFLIAVYMTAENIISSTPRHRSNYSARRRSSPALLECACVEKELIKLPPRTNTEDGKNDTSEKGQNERFVGHVILRNGVARRIDDPSGQRVKSDTKSGSSLGVEE